MRSKLLLLITLALPGCASTLYMETQAGRFSGALDVRWVENDYFVFLPNKDKPFTFVRANGQTIRPGTMYTDGGSIPRFLWGIKGYSPWGYAPGYIIHDWLFEAKHCGYQPDNQYTFQDSANILAEGLKAVMEADAKVRNYFVFDTVYAAVSSSIAEQLWNNGSCKPPPIELQYLDQRPLGELIMTIHFD